MPKYRYWKSEVANSTWHLIDWEKTNIKQVVSEGAMFMTTYVSDAPPMSSADEEMDLRENPVKRFGPLYLDLDAKDQDDVALAEVRALLFHVLPKFGIPTSVLRVWHSGSKGYHVMIPPAAFGGEAGSRTLPWIHKFMFEEIQRELELSHGTCHLDKSLYPMGKGKMFRIENVKRSNGRHKIPLKIAELHPETGLTIDQLNTMTLNPRVLPYTPPQNYTPDPRALQWYQRCSIKATDKLISKLRAVNVPLSEAQVEDLARNLPPCLIHTMKMEDYEGLDKINFNAICAYILVPYFRNAGRTLDEAEDILYDFFANFIGSESYSTVDQRIEHFRGAWRDAQRYPWKCGIVSSLLHFDCSQCSVHLKAVESAFDTCITVEGDDAPDDFRFEGARWVPFTDFERAIDADKKSTVFAYRASNIHPDDIPARDWIIKNRFVPRFCTVTVAPGGGSKSTLSTLEAIAIASGQSLTGMKVLRKGGVMLYNAEDPADEMRRKVAAMCAHHGIDHRTLSNLFYRSGQDDDAFIFAKRDPEMGLAVDRLVVEKLIQFIKKQGILLLVLDPFVRTHRVNENDNMEIDAVISVMSRIANATGCAIHIVHHTRKRSSEGGVGDMDTARGASSNVSAARVAHTLNVMTEKEAETWGVAKERASYYVRLDDAKANFTAPGKGTVWFERDDVLLPAGDHVGVLKVAELVKKESASRPGTAEVRGVIARVVRPGHRVNLTSVADIVAEDADVLFVMGGKDEKTKFPRSTARRWVEAAIGDKLILDGYCYKIITEPAGKSTRSYIECGEAVEDEGADAA